MTLSNKQRQQAYRNKHKAQKTTSQVAPQSPPTVTAIQSHPENVTKRNEIVTDGQRNVTPKTYEQETYRANSLEPPMQKYPLNYGKPDCTCQHCKQTRVNKSSLVLNHGPYKTADKLGPNEINRVSMPGDVDYVQPRDKELVALVNGKPFTIADMRKGAAELDRMQANA